MCIKILWTIPKTKNKKSNITNQFWLKLKKRKNPRKAKKGSGDPTAAANQVIALRVRVAVNQAIAEKKKKIEKKTKRRERIRSHTKNEENQILARGGKAINTINLYRGLTLLERVRNSL
jgi:hypothetical protein